MSSYQPLVSGDVDLFTTTNLTTYNGDTGIYLDVDSNNSSLLVKTNTTSALYIDKYQNVGINTIGPSAQLDINSASSNHLRLTYNASLLNKADIGVSSDGKLQLSAGGSEVSIDSTSNLNVKSHNGSTLGLTLGNSLVLATAANLNYNVVIPGTASNSKTLVLNSSGNVSGINSLSANLLTGTLETSYQPNITSVDTFDIVSHSGIAGLSLNGVLVTALGVDLNKLNNTAGTASASKVIVLDENRNISNINSLTASTLTGLIQTASQPNITSLGTVLGLDIDNQLTGLTDLSINTVEEGKTLVLNDSNGSTIRMMYDAATNTDNYVDLFVDSSGGLLLSPTSGNVDIVGHDHSSKGLKLDGVLVDASSDQINYMQGTTTGVASSNKALVVDINQNISNINSLTTTNLYGTLQTAEQPNITSTTVLDVTGHDGSTIGLKLGGVLLTATATQLNSIFGSGGAGTFMNLAVNDSLTIANADGATAGLILGSTLLTSSADELNFLNTEVGVVVESAAVVVDANKDISSFRNVTATNLTGTLQSASQPTITSLGSLTSVSTSGTLTVGSTVISETEIVKVDGVTAGLASDSKALITDENLELSGLNNLGANGLSLVGSDAVETAYMQSFQLGTGTPYNATGTSGVVAAYSPTLNVAAAFPTTAVSRKEYGIIDSKQGYGTMQNFAANAVVRGAFWHPILLKFFIITGTSPGTGSSVNTTRSSPDGITWTTLNVSTTSYQAGTNIAYHPLSGHMVYMTKTEFLYSTNGVSWSSLSLGTLLINAGTVRFNSTTVIGKYVVSNKSGNCHVVEWNSGVWSYTTILNTYTPFRGTKTYNPIEDRIYIFAGDATVAGKSITINYIDDVSTKHPSTWLTGMSTVSYTIQHSFTIHTIEYYENYGVLLFGVRLDEGAGVADTNAFQVLAFNNKLLSNEYYYTGDGTTNYTTPTGTPFLWSDGTLVVPSATTTSTFSTLYSTPIIGSGGPSEGIIFGNSSISVDEITTLNDISLGTVSASKVLITDTNKDISSINAISATTLTGTLQTAGQSLITSVGTLSNINTSGVITLGLTTVSESELLTLDSVTAGVASPSKVAVLDANKDISGISTISGNSFMTTNLTVGSTVIDEIAFIDVEGGSVVENKIVAVDANKDIATFGNLTAETLVGELQTIDQSLITSVGTLDSLNTSGDITVGSTVISETEIGKIDDITDGTASANKALIVDANKDISSINLLSMVKASVGSATDGDLPVEVGFVSYEHTGAYAFNTNGNAHGLVTAGSGVANYSARFDGRVLCQGELQITSDRRLKKNIEELEPVFASKFMSTTKPVKFNWKTEDQITDYGYIAQDISKAGFNDMISVVPHIGMEGSVDEDGFVNPEDAKLVFSPGKIIPLVALNQKSAFEELEKKNSRLSALIRKIQNLEDILKAKNTTDGII